MNDRTTELRRVNSELSLSEKEIKLKNEELTAAQEELTAQRDKLEQQNKILEANRNEIELKNQEITRQNETLEDEVKKRTAELLSNVQQLEEFAFMAAHNLRGPVARIHGLSQLLGYAIDKSETIDLQKKIGSSIHELDTVVRDLNHVLEIKSDASTVLSTVNLSEELEAALEIFKDEIEATQAQIIGDFSAVHEIQTVKKYFQNILSSLLSNALKYSDPQRRPFIRVQSKVTDKYIRVLVQDNGLGLDVKRNRDKLFKFYSRFHTHVPGKGLGLYLVRVQIEALGGNVTIYSNRDYGLTVAVSFPKS
ncbi:MAG TPA: hypothetical protein DGG95_18505 [Cytophagales bacterium]|nr:hypothetical protein [Cytophagales bacterium]